MNLRGDFITLYASFTSFLIVLYDKDAEEFTIIFICFLTISLGMATNINLNEK